MTRGAALQIVDEIAHCYRESPCPGENPQALTFFRSRLKQLQWEVPFNLDTSAVGSWANIFYSPRKWQRWGEEKVRTNLYQAIVTVRRRVNIAPDEFFETGQ